MKTHQFFEGFQNTTISLYLILKIFKKIKNKKSGREPEVFFLIKNF
jgi:hypothetical protein